MNGKLALAGFGAVLAISTLAGCGQQTASRTAAPSIGPSTAASGQPSAGPTTGGAGGTGGTGGGTGTDGGTGTGGGTGGGNGNGGGPVECRIGQLDISVTGGDAGLGHRSKVIVFRNTGSSTCVLQGYPGVAALDGSGRQVAQAQRTLNGYLGGVRAGNPPLVRLAAGASASATVEALAFGPNGDSCTAYAGLLVTPPDETRSVRVNWDSDGCSELQIHPVVAGTTGQAS
jgi:hypothetical protein